MRRWQPGDDVGRLDDWPFDNPASAYAVLSGDPRASGRLFAGGPGDVTRAGIWRCTPGRFSCIEQGDELMTILSGKGSILDHSDGTETPFAPGDTLFSIGGRRVTWQVEETVTKVFYGHKPEGF